MARHEVVMSFDEKVVLHKDTEFEIKVDGAKLGTLMISKGNIEWLPANNSVNKYRLAWKKFAELMEEQGTPVRKPQK